MIAGRPPGRVAKLFSAWADWFFAKLSPPAPRREAKVDTKLDTKSDTRTQPPRLVRADDRKPDDRAGKVASAGRR